MAIGDQDRENVRGVQGSIDQTSRSLEKAILYQRLGATGRAMIRAERAIREKYLLDEGGVFFDPYVMRLVLRKQIMVLVKRSNGLREAKAVKDIYSTINSASSSVKSNQDIDAEMRLARAQQKAQIRYDLHMLADYLGSYREVRRFMRMGETARGYELMKLGPEDPLRRSAERLKRSPIWQRY